ncbi:SGNH/GDSL hydrolase family protein [Collinsella sp. An268]|uniref:SGNH/GDSL hydrolase family protein n=1 Tax=Collinsella sp. An268 TaxID=1965612 RepID=UPI0011814BDE|nr:SGNH/GDSL hydrolase family protein [Collinsella sp. An268]
MPRPFYSLSLGRHIIQLVDNAARHFFSSLIRAIDGTEQWVSPEAFDRCYADLLDKLVMQDMAIVCCSCVYIDERLFPGTPEQYKLFSRLIRTNTQRRNVCYLDLYALLKRSVSQEGWDKVYNKDHFHPNGGGYKLIAKEIANAIMNESPKSCMPTKKLHQSRG